MEKIINGTSISPEENNALFEEGFLFRVEGDWEITAGVDGWSGMPNTKGNIHYFTNADEAEAYAEKQVWVFNSNVHGTVEVVSHMETRAEYEAKMAKAKAEREAKTAEKAKALNMTVEDYKAYKSVQAKKKRYAREIAELEAEIENLKEEIERKSNYIKEH